MKFCGENYTVEEKTVAGETLICRAWRNRVYADRPVNPEFQQMNIFAPEAYFQKTDVSIGGYTKETAPVFVPNTVGGYMPGPLAEPGPDPYRSREGKEVPNTIFRALQHGYIVAAPAIRGRVQKDESGRYTGKAPACIVDYKAAVRYLHYFSEELPGDESKIITNGTSAGGAISSLMGAAGDHPDYEPYLQAIGAADASDAVFAASCYCPITNLDNADTAYEWEFCGEKEYHRARMDMDAGGRPHFTPVDGIMTEEQTAVSRKLKAMFPSYVNSLGLKDVDGVLRQPAGMPLTLDADGNGTFKEFIKKVVMTSAQTALDGGEDLSDKKWLTVSDQKTVTGMDWDGYIHDITRMKEAPAFDGLHMETPETNLFGTETIDSRHFSVFSAEQGDDSICAEKSLIKVMNPMYYIGDAQARTAKYFRIRHGETDRDTSLAISAILTLKLREAGVSVDYASPWNTPHSGDYDLEELFAWIDQICMQDISNNGMK